MREKRVALVGCGVMGEAIIKSLIEAGITPTELVIREKKRERLSELQILYGVSQGPISDCDAVILAVKPQDLNSTVAEIGSEITNDTLLISLLAGVKISELKRRFDEKVRVIRVMTNTPLLAGEGMSVIAAGPEATAEDLSWVVNILSKSGKILVQPEDSMDIVTAISGSGPAYFFGFVEAIIESALNLGLTKQDSRLLVEQTFIGAAKMIQESGKDATSLRNEVTSPNGTTHAAFEVLRSNNFSRVVFDAIRAARDRSKELSEE